ncbi:UNVERIFIED_CONTAM: hypothetical protein K2H54_064163 [Gekko kuhli]
MSGEEGQGAPATTAEQTLVTTAVVPVSMTPLKTYLLTQGPRRDSQFDTGLFQSLDGQVPRQSGAVGVGASRAWITERSNECKDYLLPKEDEEEDVE